jgi:hypothetical protein
MASGASRLQHREFLKISQEKCFQVGNQYQKRAWAETFLKGKGYLIQKNRRERVAT